LPYPDLPYREVLLPSGHRILQDGSSQGISLASELLYQETLAAKEDAPIKALELGSGCGIVSIMCAFARPMWEITGLELQPELASLARHNAKICHLGIDFREADLRHAEGSYHLIYANPPWRKLKSGLLSPIPARNISRFEITCTMKDVLDAIARLLLPDGKAILIYPEERLEELIQEATNTLLDTKKHRKHGGNKAYVSAIITHRDMK